MEITIKIDDREDSFGLEENRLKIGDIVNLSLKRSIKDNLAKKQITGDFVIMSIEHSVSMGGLSNDNGGPKYKSTLEMRQLNESQAEYDQGCGLPVDTHSVSLMRKLTGQDEPK